MELVPWFFFTILLNEFITTSFCTKWMNYSKTFSQQRRRSGAQKEVCRKNAVRLSVQESIKCVIISADVESKLKTMAY